MTIIIVKFVLIVFWLEVNLMFTSSHQQKTGNIMWECEGIVFSAFNLPLQLQPALTPHVISPKQRSWAVSDTKMHKV